MTWKPDVTKRNLLCRYFRKKRRDPVTVWPSQGSLFWLQYEEQFLWTTWNKRDYNSFLFIVNITGSNKWSQLTCVLASTAAPLRSNKRTILMFLIRQAMWRTVSPRWKHNTNKHVNNTFTQSKSIPSNLSKFKQSHVLCTSGMNPSFFWIIIQNS